MSSHGPESYAGGSVTTGRVPFGGQVKEKELDWDAVYQMLVVDIHLIHWEALQHKNNLQLTSKKKIP